MVTSVKCGTPVDVFPIESCRDLKTDTLVDVLLDPCRYTISVKTGWAGVSIL